MPTKIAPLPDRLVVRTLSNQIINSLAKYCDVMNLDMISLLVFTAVWTANTGHLTDGNRFAQMIDLPPDHFRRPISLGDLAVRLRLPTEMVADRVAELEAMGLLQADERGIWAPTGVFTRADVLRTFGTMVGDAEELAYALNSHGLPSAA